MSDFQLKNRFNRAFYQQIADEISKHQPTFNTVLFLERIYDGKHEERELKDRMHHCATVLNDVLSGSYADKVAILRQVAPLVKDGLTGLVFPDFVEFFGQDEADFDVSIAALEDVTKYSSSEFAVRPFIKKYRDRMMAQMTLWATDKDYHVRRLACEGCRPRLPWAMALPHFQKDPSMVLPILEQLKNDETDYVRRSVANNLNDISKDHPELVLEIAERWYGDNKNTDWIVKHACRTLLKAGNKRAMRLFGFGDSSAIIVQNLRVKHSVLELGGNQMFSFELSHKMAQAAKIRLEFGVYYMKKNGTHSRKVFKISENVYEPHQVFSFEKKMHFRDLTTRKHHAGEHRIAIIVNGVEKETVTFELKING